MAQNTLAPLLWAYSIPSPARLSLKLSPANWRALVLSLKPRYTASAPLSTAAFNAGKLPAGQTSSMDTPPVKFAKTIRGRDFRGIDLYQQNQRYPERSLRLLTKRYSTHHYVLPDIPS